MVERTSLVAGDYADPSVFTRLAEAVGPDAFAVHYLAVPPSLFGTVADGIAAAGLAPRLRLIVEKPFGHDLASARALNDRLSAHYPEDRVFRVDHFLGKEPVEDLLVLRFANTLLEPLWDREWIDHFEITMAEDFDVADRGSFYDAVGTVRDVVQNHLLQVLAYLLMEPPTRRRPTTSATRSTACCGHTGGGPGRGGPGALRRLHRDARGQGGVDHRDVRRAHPARRQLAVGGRAGLPARGEGAPGHAARRRRGAAHAAAAAVHRLDDAPPPNRVRLRIQPDAGITLTVLAKRPGDATWRCRSRSPPTSGRCSARCTRRTSASSPTRWRATRPTSPGSTTWRRPGGSSARSSTPRAPPRRTPGLVGPRRGRRAARAAGVGGAAADGILKVHTRQAA